MCTSGYRGEGGESRAELILWNSRVGARRDERTYTGKQQLACSDLLFGMNIIRQSSQTFRIRG